MNGFDREFAWGGPPNPEYVYVPHNESQPYFDMAHEGVLADRMFQSHLDQSFVSHQYIIAAQAAAHIESLPTGARVATAEKPDQVTGALAAADDSSAGKALLRLHDSRRRAGSRGLELALLHQSRSPATAVSGQAIRRCVTSVTAPVDERRHRPADAVHHRYPGRVSCQRHLDHAACSRAPTTRAAAAAPDPSGSGRW